MIGSNGIFKHAYTLPATWNEPGPLPDSATSPPTAEENR